jgi:hypothetical protein
MVAMKLELPDNLTDEQKAAIVQIILEHGGSIIDIETVKQTVWDRFIQWWYSFWRMIGFS